MRGHALRLGLAVLLLLPQAGCGVLNPDFVASLGLDPGLFSPVDQGVVLVAFDNQTDFDAVFFAWAASDAGDLTAGSRNFSSFVPAGEQRNEVVRCPVGAVGPGSLTADFTLDPLAAQVRVVTDTGVDTADVEATVPVESGVAFDCGDLIVIRLQPTIVQADQEADFVITVQVVPSR
jgi:hypothetical protein